MCLGQRPPTWQVHPLAGSVSTRKCGKGMGEPSLERGSTSIGRSRRLPIGGRVEAPIRPCLGLAQSGLAVQTNSDLPIHSSDLSSRTFGLLLDAQVRQFHLSLRAIHVACSPPLHLGLEDHPVKCTP